MGDVVDLAGRRMVVAGREYIDAIEARRGEGGRGARRAAAALVRVGGAPTQRPCPPACAAPACAAAPTLPRSTVQQSSCVACRATSSSVMPRRGRPPPSPARSGCVCVSRTQSIWLNPFSNGTLRRRGGGAGSCAWPPAAGGCAPPPPLRSVTVAPLSSGFCGIGGIEQRSAIVAAGRGGGLEAGAALGRSRRPAAHPCRQRLRAQRLGLGQGGEGEAAAIPRAHCSRNSLLETLVAGPQGAGWSWGQPAAMRNLVGASYPVKAAPAPAAAAAAAPLPPLCCRLSGALHLNTGATSRDLHMETRQDNGLCDDAQSLHAIPLPLRPQLASGAPLHSPHCRRSSTG